MVFRVPHPLRPSRGRRQLIGSAPSSAGDGCCANGRTVGQEHRVQPRSCPHDRVRWTGRASRASRAKRGNGWAGAPRPTTLLPTRSARWTGETGEPGRRAGGTVGQEHRVQPRSCPHDRVSRAAIAAGRRCRRRQRICRRDSAVPGRTVAPRLRGSGWTPAPHRGRPPR